jgi:sulfatase maturation enzyme AslB (radical SAM superfamily)
MSNQFCRFLSNGYSFSAIQDPLILKPCCWYQGGIVVDKNVNKNKDVQSQINDWTPECSICQTQEKAGQKSYRQSSFEILPESNSNVPLAIDINLDRTCNAACVMCGPQSSTLWAKQFKEYKVIEIYNEHSVSKTIDYILKNFDFSQVKRIKFYGGEPLLTDTHLKILRKIPNPKQCEIWYTTNASVFPKQNVLKLWEKFKLVFFEASIDGIQDRFNYIRWPLKWEKVSQNLLELKELAPTNLLFRVSYTLNPFNIFYYNELEEWFQHNLSTNKLGDASEINVHPCWGQWDLKKTPSSLREVIFKKYPNSIISDILMSLNIESYDTIAKFTSKYDSLRNNSWKQTFPEIVKYFP